MASKYNARNPFFLSHNYDTITLTTLLVTAVRHPPLEALESCGSELTWVCSVRLVTCLRLQLVNQILT
ncbi:hypothetical protein HanHA89_Chr02g0041151 [Helianthus annuus]|nr:hypothetical protein HanHA89_Chr02g0041151 [Helianthus annuus]